VRNAKHGHRRDRGAAAVEMALVLPLLISMLFGVIDFGRVFNAEIQLSQAAREGARIAALGATAGDPVARAIAAAPAPGFGGGGAVTGTAVVCPAAPAAGADGVVTVRFAFTFFLPLLPDRTLTQTARMRCGG
jgi:Flp pilus assembly protein TadG